MPPTNHESCRVRYQYGSAPAAAAAKCWSTHDCRAKLQSGVAEKRFLADAAITDKLVQLQRKEEGEKKGTSRTGKVDGRRGKEGEGVQR